MSGYAGKGQGRGFTSLAFVRPLCGFWLSWSGGERSSCEGREQRILVATLRWLAGGCEWLSLMSKVRYSGDLLVEDPGGTWRILKWSRNLHHLN